MQTKNTGKNLKIHNNRNSGNNLAHNERCGPGLQQEAPSPTISVHRRADDQLLGQGKDGDDHNANVMMMSMMITMMMINCMDKDEADKFFDDMEARPSPRMIKTHYPFEFLPPNLLETCKVTKDFKVTM